MAATEVAWAEKASRVTTMQALFTSKAQKRKGAVAWEVRRGSSILNRDINNK